MLKLRLRNLERFVIVLRADVETVTAQGTMNAASEAGSKNTYRSKVIHLILRYAMFFLKKINLLN